MFRSVLDIYYIAIWSNVFWWFHVAILPGYTVEPRLSSCIWFGTRNLKLLKMELYWRVAWLLKMAPAVPQTLVLQSARRNRKARRWRKKVRRESPLQLQLRRPIAYCVSEPMPHLSFLFLKVGLAKPCLGFKWFKWIGCRERKEMWEEGKEEEKERWQEKAWGGEEEEEGDRRAKEKTWTKRRREKAEEGSW